MCQHPEVREWIAPSVFWYTWLPFQCQMSRPGQRSENDANEYFDLTLRHKAAVIL